jgi:gliding motility-associated-like protein
VGTGAWTVVTGTGGSFVSATNPTTTFSGTAGTAYVLRWTISNAPCTASTDDVNITFNQSPTVANAGADQNLPNGTITTTLTGNIPSVGTGLWTVVSGTASITSPVSPVSGVTGLANGAATLQWTITNAPCISFDVVDIIVSGIADNEAVYTLTPPLNVDSYSNGNILASVTDADGSIISAIISAGTLPAGVSLNAINGTITVSDKTLLAAGTYTFNVTTTDITGLTTTNVIILTFSADIEAVYTISAAQNATSYANGTSLATVIDANGTVVGAVVTTGSLPAGVGINTTTGAITITDNTLLVGGTYTFSVTTTDNTGGTTVTPITLNFTTEIEAVYVVAPAQNVTSYANGTSLATVTDANGTVTSAVVTTGSLPAGVSINATTGAITVTDNTLLLGGSYTFSVTTTDNTGGTTITPITLNFTTEIEAVYSIAPAQNVTSYANGTSLATVIDANGTVVGAVVSAGSLPAGVSINATTGEITVFNSALLVGGSYTFSVTTTDNTGGVTVTPITLNFTTEIEAVYVVAPAQNVTSYTNGQSLATVTDANGTVTSAVVTAGSLPAGVSINATIGEITVSNSALLVGGTYTFSVTTTDNTGGTTITPITLNFTTEIEAVYVVAPAQNVTSYTNGQSLATVTDANGTVTSAVVTAGSLPAGVSINATTGEITVSNSTLLVGGTYTFSVTTTDNTGGTTITPITLNFTTEIEAVYVVAPAQNVTSYANGTSLATVSDANGTVVGAVVSAGSLPAGVSINATTGEITVSNSALLVGGTYTFSVTTTDNTGGVTVTPITLNFTTEIEAVYVVAPAQNVTSYTNGQSLATVSDANGTVVGAVVTTGSLPAGVSINATTGQITVTDNTLLVANTYTFDVTTIDNTGGITVQTVSITFSNNTSPVANNDTAPTSISEDSAGITFSVTTNDTDVDGTINVASVDLDPSTVGIQNTFTNAQGTWSVDALGNLTFTPALNFNGIASITYAVNDNNGATSNPATIAVTISPVNDAPILGNDAIATATNIPVSGDLTNASDIDPDGTALTTTVIPVSGPSNGTIVINTDGTYTYTPTAGFNGTDVITVQVCDSGLPLPALCANQTLTINISAAGNIAPVAVNDSPTTNEDTPITFSSTANDTDVDGTVDVATVDLDPSTAGIQNTFANAQGTFTVNTTGDVTFTPVLNFNGSTAINYTVNDSNGATSNIATIAITVNAINDAPVLTNLTPITAEDTPFSGSVFVGTDVDPDGTALTVNTTSVSGPSNGTIIINPDGTYTYTPNLNFNGTDVVTIQICDSGLPLPAACSTKTITFNVTSVNDVPVAVNDSPTTNEDTPVTFSATTNDTDVDGTINVASVDLDPSTAGVQNTFTNAQGTWSVDALGNVTFTPALNFNGTASITYTVNDNSGATSNVATLAIVVSPVNDAPVLSNDVASANAGLPVSGSILNTSDSDPDGTALVVTTTPVSGPSNGTITINTDGTYTYTPTAGFSGTDVVTIQVCDSGLPLPAMCATETLTITVINNPLQAVNDNSSTNEDTPVIINVVSNDLGSVSASTVDLDPATSGIQTTFTNAQGVWSVDALGNITFTPALNFNGTASIPYTVKDANGIVSNAGTISIIVNQVNDAPVVVNQANRTQEGTPVSGNILTGDTDPERTVLTVNPVPVQAPLNGTIVINTDGTYTYTPNLGFAGTETIVVQVCDNGLPLPAICSLETIEVTVVPEKDVVVPEGFSPNGDGVNDTFVIKNHTNEKISLEIYNRWGNIVFKNENYQNDWGGIANFGVVLGQGLPDGTYYYIVEIGNFKETRFMTIHR